MLITLPGEFNAYYAYFVSMTVLYITYNNFFSLFGLSRTFPYFFAELRTNI